MNDTLYICRLCGESITPDDVPPYRLKRHDIICKACHKAEQKMYREIRDPLPKKLQRPKKKQTDKSSSHFTCIICNQLLQRDNFKPTNIASSTYVCNACEPVYKKQLRDKVMNEYISSLTDTPTHTNHLYILQNKRNINQLLHYTILNGIQTNTKTYQINKDEPLISSYYNIIINELTEVLNTYIINQIHIDDTTIVKHLNTEIHDKTIKTPFTVLHNHHEFIIINL